LHELHRGGCRGAVRRRVERWKLRVQWADRLPCNRGLRHDHAPVHDLVLDDAALQRRLLRHLRHVCRRDRSWRVRCRRFGLYGLFDRQPRQFVPRRHGRRCVRLFEPQRLCCRRCGRRRVRHDDSHLYGLVLRDPGVQRLVLQRDDVRWWYADGLRTDRGDLHRLHEQRERSQLHRDRVWMQPGERLPGGELVQPEHAHLHVVVLDDATLQWNVLRPELLHVRSLRHRHPDVRRARRHVRCVLGNRGCEVRHRRGCGRRRIVRVHADDRLPHRLRL